MLNPPTSTEDHQIQEPLIFDASVLRHQTNIPKQFIWPDDEKPVDKARELVVPLIDLGGFLSGDPAKAMEATNLVRDACQKHGFFLVVNHGVDGKLIQEAHNYINSFFGLPLEEKQSAQRKLGEHCGYASSFIGRFSSKLPWKETFSFGYSAKQNSSSAVKEYIRNKMGESFSEFG